MSNKEHLVDEIYTVVSNLRDLEVEGFNSVIASDVKINKIKLINIEIKPPQKDCELVKKVVETIHEYGIVENSIVSCFDPECIRLVKEFDKNVKTGLLYEDDELGNEIMTFGVAKFCKQLNADATHPHRKLITHKEVIELHNLGIAVNPWTVNKEEEIIKFVNWGCDALISDVPDYCLKVLEGIK